MKRRIVYRGRKFGLQQLTFVEIVRQDYAPLGTWPLDLVEIQIAQAIINRLAFVYLIDLRLVRLRSNDHIRPQVNDVAEILRLVHDRQVALRDFRVGRGVSITFLNVVQASRL